MKKWGGNMDLSINSKFYHFMSKVADCMILSVLWIVFSLPVITAGAATSALYYCVIKVIGEDQGSAVKSFWRSFKSCLKQGTIVSIAVFALSILVTIIGSAAYARAQNGEALSTVYFVYLIFFLFGIAWLHYIFSYIARFQAPLATVLKNSLVICLVNLPSSFSMMILFVIMVILLIWTFPASAMALLLIPAVYALISGFLLEKIYSKYLPEPEAQE